MFTHQNKIYELPSTRDRILLITQLSKLKPWKLTSLALVLLNENNDRYKYIEMVERKLMFKQKLLLYQECEF